MIKSINIKDFALIQDIDINFFDGLTVLTGETGAGKSIILESLHLLFAKRSDQEMIRHGKDRAIVSGVFSLNKVQQELFDLPEEIFISREIDKSGRHKISINNQVTTLGRLKEITETIGSIHSQNDTFLLLDNNEYLNFIDQVDQKEVTKLLSNYLISRSNYLDLKKHLEKIKQKKQSDIEQKDFLQYQIEELNSFNLVLGEKEELELSYEKLKHFDKISNSLKETYYELDNNVNIALLYNSAKQLEGIASFDEDYKESSEKLLNSYYEFNDVKEVISRKLGELDYDENEFNFIQERIFELNKLEEKYQKTIAELIVYLDEATEKIELIDNYDEYILSYEKKVLEEFTKTYDLGIKLSNYRQKLATKLEKQIIKELSDLDLEKAQFEIKFNTLKDTLLDTGIDEVEFYISLNEGEPLRVLSKVASGGERARFMFALKTIYAYQNNLQLLILDEIDIGISGKVAAMMANKMQKISQDMQLIVITHLPQVAAKANNHFGITKNIKDGRMTTSIDLLTMNERIEMIALMLSDESLSHFAIEQAKMLLGK